MAVHKVRTFSFFFFGFSNNFFFGLSTNICIEILSLFSFYNFQSPSNCPSGGIFPSFASQGETRINPPERYFKRYEAQRETPHQKGFSRIPVPSGEKGFTLAHIKASFSETADFPSSRKNTGPCAAKKGRGGREKARAHVDCVKAATRESAFAFIEGPQNLIYNYHPHPAKTVPHRLKALMRVTHRKLSEVVMFQNPKTRRFRILTFLV